MSYPYIRISRRSAALYLAWEFGIARARAILADPAIADPAAPGFVRLRWSAFLTDRSNGRRTRRCAEQYAARIRQVVAWQEGRLRRRLTGGDVYVVA